MNEHQPNRRSARHFVQRLLAVGLLLALFGAMSATPLAATSLSSTQVAAGGFASISSGDEFTCGIKTGGTITCWGDNSSGQLNAPSGTFTQVSAGALHTCAIRTSGSVACWGGNGAGQASPPAGTFVQISAGQSFTCGIKADGTLTCWGSNSNNQRTPVPSGTFRQVSAGSYHACAIHTDNTVACWGDDTYGQANPPSGRFIEVASGSLYTCGLKTDGTLTCWDQDPFQLYLTTPSGTFTQLSSGYNHACAVATDGTVKCWGDVDSSAQTPPSGTFVQVAAGSDHTCGVRSNGGVSCWGDNSAGQLNAPSGTFSRAQVAGGAYHTCGIRTDGTLGCWGLNANGQTNAPSGSFTQITAGFYHSCALKTDGTLACWGLNDDGQSSPSTGTFTQVSAGGFFTCGVRTSASLACWGNDDYHQLTDKPTGSFVQVAAGGYHACAIKTDGTLTCWGNNSFGQLNSIPSGTFTQITAGFFHTCGIKSNGTLACWGDDSSNQLNNIPSGTFTQISGGGYATCGVKTDGTLDCWGSSSQGQTTPPSGTFTQAAGGGYHFCGVQSNDVVTCWGDNGSGQFGVGATITSTAISAVIDESFYSHTFTATGTPAPTFSVTSGSLPPGLSLNSTSGVLSGTPTAEGIFTGTVTASNGFLSTDSQAFSFTVDVNPPSTTATAKNADNSAYSFGTWTRQSVTVTLSATDSGSGVDSTTYTIDGGSQTDYSGPFTITSEGDHSLVFWSVDNVAHEETHHTVHVMIDKSPPSISGAPTTSPNGNGWYNGSVTIHFTCSDTFSGVASCSSDKTLSANGTNQKVSGSATDNVGFSATASSSPGVNIDTIKPVSSASAKKADNTTYTFGTWTSPSATVSLTASDTGSGVASIFYTIDGGGQNTYSAPFIINTNGDHTVVFWSVDLADNVEASHTVHVMIALNGPNISGAPTTGPTGDNGWYNTPVTIHWTCTPNGAPVLTCPSDQVVTTEGSNVTASGTATDTAGNSTTASAGPLMIDLTPPAITFPGNQGTYTFDQTVDITCKATDAVSGVASSTCQDISGPAFMFGYGITFSPTVSATDNAGNTSQGSTSFMVVAPDSTPRASLVAYSGTTLKLTAYIVTGRSGGRPSGFLSYSDGNVTLSSVRVMSLTVFGVQATVYGTAKLGDGTPVTFRLDTGTTFPSTTVRLRLNNGYDSGDQTVTFLRVSPVPSSSTKQ